MSTNALAHLADVSGLVGRLPGCRHRYETEAKHIIELVKPRLDAEKQPAAQ
jgi:hypothetical protein